jgi:hypothetical protein
VGEDAGPFRLAELCGVVSLACDLALGQPLESGIRSTLVALGMADALGLGVEARPDVFYLNLLRMAGCTACPEMTRPLGDLRELAALFDADGVAHATFQDDPVGVHNVDLTGITGSHLGIGLPTRRRDQLARA